MRKRGFTRGIVTGSILGITAGTILSPILAEGMGSRNFRKMKRNYNDMLEKAADMASAWRRML